MCFPFLTPYIAPMTSESDTEDEDGVCVLCGEDAPILFDLCEDCEEVVEPAKCDGCEQTISMSGYSGFVAGTHQEAKPGDENHPPNNIYAFCPECLHDYLSGFPDPSQDDDY